MFANDFGREEQSLLGGTHFKSGLEHERIVETLFFHPPSLPLSNGTFARPVYKLAFHPLCPVSLSLHHLNMKSFNVLAGFTAALAVTVSAAP